MNSMVLCTYYACAECLLPHVNNRSLGRILHFRTISGIPVIALQSAKIADCTHTHIHNVKPSHRWPMRIYARIFTHSEDYAIARCLSVRLSHAGILKLCSQHG